jgi:hypothetical protein
MSQQDYIAANLKMHGVVEQFVQQYVYIIYKVFYFISVGQIFNSCVVPVLIYGCEFWKSPKSSDTNLINLENKCVRKVTSTHWKEFKLNETLREETKQKYISDVIRKRRW